ncbi:MAG: nucleotide-binding universal stress UspA family protein [Glaciecola sp.]|jgi:nucleotide-binding universal stress UspA family protein
METILLPTDFSKNSLNAIDFAMKMFKETNCTFYILNIQKASSFVSDDLMTASPSVNLYQAIINTAKKSLDNLIKSVKSKYKNSRHELIPIIDYDNFIDAINQMCEASKIDLIVTGTKVNSGLEKVVFGSNTLRVMQRGIVPVLAIPYNYKYKKFNRIVFLNYLTQYKTEDLLTLFKIIRFYNSKVDIIHVSQGELLTQDQERNVRLINNLFAETPNKFIDLKGEDVFKEVNYFIK